MAKRPQHRYTEARMYLAGGSIGLLLIVWSVLAMKDLAGSATTSAQTLVALIPPTAAPVATPQPALIPPTAPVATPQPALIPPTALVATPQPAAASSNSSSGGSTAEPQATAEATAEPTATASPRPTQKPQTRSRGS